MNLDQTETVALPATVPSYLCPERRLIAQHLGVTEERLKQAVRAVGPKLNTVRIFLGR